MGASVILDKTDAGHGLKLWYGQAAVDRGDWEEALSQRLSLQGFQRVVSPYLYKRELHSAYEDWAGLLKDHPFVTLMHRDSDGGRDNAIVDEQEKYDECRQYVYLGHKGLNHTIMMQEGQSSYRDLPKRYYEFAEIYGVTNNQIVNEAGLYMSVMCELSNINDEAASLFAFIAQHVGNDRMRVGKYGIKLGTATDLQYIDSTNAKAEAGLVLARIRVHWRKPGD